MSYYYGHDHLYSPVILVSASGSIEDRYGQTGSDPFSWPEGPGSDPLCPGTWPDCGNPPPRSKVPVQSAGLTSGFTGREVDYLDNGSLPLQYNRHRYYLQSLGRWTSEDPLGIDPGPSGSSSSFDVLQQYNDGLSLYVYVLSEPVASFDPYGLYSWNNDSGGPDGKECYSLAIRRQFEAPRILKAIGINSVKVKFNGQYKSCQICCPTWGQKMDKRINIGVVAMAEFGSPERRLGLFYYRIGWYGVISGEGTLAAYYNPCQRTWEEAGGCVSIGGELGGIAAGGFQAGDWISAEGGGRVGVNVTGKACLVMDYNRDLALKAQVCISSRGRIWAKVQYKKRKPWEAFYEISKEHCTDWKTLQRWSAN